MSVRPPGFCLVLSLRGQRELFEGRRELGTEREGLVELSPEGPRKWEKGQAGKCKVALTND